MKIERSYTLYYSNVRNLGSAYNVECKNLLMCFGGDINRAFGVITG